MAVCFQTGNVYVSVASGCFGGAGGGDIWYGVPPLLSCWPSKGSGEKLQTGFFLGAELDEKTQRETRGPCGARAFQV